MTRDEAIHTLQAFGEGIMPSRLMDDIVPSHDDWHTAVGVLCNLPWDNYRRDGRHGEHHTDIATSLGIDAASDEGHAEHSTQIMAAIAKQLGRTDEEDEPGDDE